MYKVFLLAEAELEVDEAYNWYEEKQIGLGDRFYKELSNRLALLEKNLTTSPLSMLVNYIKIHLAHFLS